MRPVRTAAALAVAVLSFVLLPFLASPAQAATCPTYPPTPGATLSVSATVVNAGDSITVTGANFVAGASVRLELHSDPVTLATVTVGADGTFSTEVTIPDSFANTGGHELVAVGGQSEACPADPAAISVGGGDSPLSPPGGLSFTGTTVATYLLVAAALIGAGVLLARSGRRGRPAGSRHSA